MTENKFQSAVEKMDSVNAADPNFEIVAGKQIPASLIYAQRMSATLDKLCPGANETLRLSVRAQHIERWKVPRDDYPQGRVGYHKWRNDLKARHGETAAKILRSVGYDEEAIERVRALITKQNLRTDQDAQALEDTACIVFFEHYAAAFSAKHDAEKIKRIVAKTWAKMSESAREHALGLDIPAGLKNDLKSLGTKT